MICSWHLNWRRTFVCLFLFVLTDKRRQHVWRYRNRERRTAKTVTPGTKEAFKVKWLRINGLNQLNFKNSIFLPHWKKGCVNVRRSNKKIALSLVKLFREESQSGSWNLFPSVQPFLHHYLLLSSCASYALNNKGFTHIIVYCYCI